MRATRVRFPVEVILLKLLTSLYSWANSVFHISHVVNMYLVMPGLTTWVIDDERYTHQLPLVVRPSDKYLRSGVGRSHPYRLSLQKPMVESAQLVSFSFSNLNRNVIATKVMDIEKVNFDWTC